MCRGPTSWQGISPGLGRILYLSSKLVVGTGKEGTSLKNIIWTWIHEHFDRNISVLSEIHMNKESSQS